jgi:hypothetical protein
MWIAMDVRFLLAFRFRRSRRSVGTLQKHATAAIALMRTRSGQLWSRSKNCLRPEADIGP